MFGICLILDGSEVDSETGYATIEEAVAEATFLNNNPPNRFDEDGHRIYPGEWVAYRVSDGKTFR